MEHRAQMHVEDMPVLLRTGWAHPLSGVRTKHGDAASPPLLAASRRHSMLTRSEIHSKVAAHSNTIDFPCTPDNHDLPAHQHLRHNTAPHGQAHMQLHSTSYNAERDRARRVRARPVLTGARSGKGSGHERGHKPHHSARR